MAKNHNTLISKIKTSINRNNLIHDTTHFTLTVKTSGFLFWKKNEFHIIGRVDLAQEKEQIDKILAEEVKSMPLINNLRVQKR